MHSSTVIKQKKRLKNVLIVFYIEITMPKIKTFLILQQLFKSFDVPKKSDFCWDKYFWRLHVQFVVDADFECSKRFTGRKERLAPKIKINTKLYLNLLS